MENVNEVRYAKSDLFHLALDKINEIEFTHREIDILACIISGRTAKKTALLLSISPKTVENHIRNLMLKTNCGTQGCLIDFVEKSEHFSLLKKHYSYLLIESFFKEQLKKISAHIKTTPNCLLIYNKNQKSKIPDFLKKHLQLLKVSVLFEPNDENRLAHYLKNEMKFDNIIYCLSVVNPDELQVNCQESIKNSFLTQLIYKARRTILFVLVDHLDHFDFKKNSPGIELIHLIDCKSYYFFVFEIFKKMVPELDISQNIFDFEKKYKMYCDRPDFNVQKTYADPLSKNGNQYPFEKSTKIRKKSVYFSVVLLIFIAGCFFILNLYSHQKLIPQYLIAGKNNTILLKNIRLEKILKWNVPKQDHLFIGRKELIKKLDAELRDPSKNKKIRRESFDNSTKKVVVCAGLGGIGKTQLALQYTHHAKHGYTLRAWFAAENTDQLKQQYIEFAKVLGYKEEKPSIESSLPYLKEWLSNHPGWLLVYDNVISYAEIESYLPEEGGSVILTSRQQQWPSAFKILDIEVMTESESIELIQSLTQREMTEIEQESAKELSKILGYLPLALAQASAYIYQTQMTIKDYLNLYNSHEQELLKDSTLPEDTNSLPIAVTWNISLEAIVKEAKEKHEPLLALELLNVCAYLAPEKISHHLLLTWLQEAYPTLSSPELVLQKLIAQLWRYSMINREERNITVHRLVQAVVRNQHNQSPDKNTFEGSCLTLEWYGLLLKNIHDEFNYKTHILEDELRQKKLLPHLQMLLIHYKKRWPTHSELSLIPIINDIGAVFSLIGEPKTARSYYERILPILEQHYGKDHFEVAHLLNQLGRECRYLGDAQKAKALHERALKIQEQYYGKDHFEVALTLHQLGRECRYLGDAQKAKELHERALKIQEQYYGKDHFEVAFTLEQLGKDYRYLGDVQKAKELQERALKIQEQYYGEDHFEVAHTLHQLGRDYRDLGDAQKAKELYERALKIKEQYYGKDHFEVAHTLDQLGQDGDAQKAKELHERALKIKEQYYGRDHVQVAHTLEQLGRDYRDLGEVQKAKELHERALKIKEQYYGKDHVRASPALEQLGRDYRDLGDAQKAEQLHERALKIKEQYYGPDHFEVALTLDQLGNDCRDLGDSKKAKEFHERALTIKKQYYGINHIEIAHTLYELNRDKGL